MPAAIGLPRVMGRLRRLVRQRRTAVGLRDGSIGVCGGSGGSIFACGGWLDGVFLTH
jgi:hypothetical protein